MDNHGHPRERYRTAGDCCDSSRSPHNRGRRASTNFSAAEDRLYSAGPDQRERPTSLEVGVGGRWRACNEPTWSEGLYSSKEGAPDNLSPVYILSRVSR